MPETHSGSGFGHALGFWQGLNILLHYLYLIYRPGNGHARGYEGVHPHRGAGAEGIPVPVTQQTQTSTGISVSGSLPENSKILYKNTIYFNYYKLYISLFGLLG